METVRVLVDEPLYTILLEDDELVISILTSGKPDNLTTAQAALTESLLDIMPAEDLAITRRQHQVEFRWWVEEDLAAEVFAGMEDITHEELLAATCGYSWQRSRRLLELG